MNPCIIAGIRIPDSEICREATELARTVVSPAVFNHSLRSFVLAELIGNHRGLLWDSELLYLATIMHDIGLAPQFRSETERFEVDGANFAREFLRSRGFSIDDQDVVWNSIALHSSGSIARWHSPAVAIANAGIIADVHGAHLEGLDPAGIRGLLLEVPRTDFAPEFLRALTDIAKTKPESTANTFVADVGHRLVPGFQLPNFVDDMQGLDPFDAFIEPAVPS